MRLPLVRNSINAIVLVMFLALFAIIAGKLFFNTVNQNAFLYWYGIVVTSSILLTFWVRFGYYREPYDTAQERERRGEIDEEAPLVSCLVAAYNEEDDIRACVESLVAQTYSKKEIIFVNDKSTDRTGGILDEYAEQGLIDVIHMEENQGKKKALARAMLRSRGSIIAFSDSDSIWDVNAIDVMVRIMRTHPDVGAISGHTRALNAEDNLLTKIQDSWYEGQFAIRKAYESVFGAVTCVSGPLAVFRREAIYNYIPAWIHDSFLGQEFLFATDRTLTGFVLGATSVGEKLKEKYKNSAFMKENYPVRDWKIIYSYHARAHTIVPDTFPRMIRQQVRWKKSFIRNLFFTGAFYWKRPLLAALMYYLHILFVIIGPFIVFRHLIYLPLQGNFFSAFLYLSGILFVGFLFGLAHKIQEPNTRRWRFRPLMSMLSTMVLSWLLFYSTLTIKKMIWSRK